MLASSLEARYDLRPNSTATASRGRLANVLGAVVLLGCLAGLLQPFEKPTYDNRPENVVEVVEVTPEGDLHLADGRRVSLRGARIPEDPVARDNFNLALKRLAGNGIVVEQDRVIGFRDTRGFCGNCRMTWNPFMKSRPRYRAFDVTDTLTQWGICGPATEAATSR